jgi:hypothetical protein
VEADLKGILTKKRMIDEKLIQGLKS